MAKMIDKEPTIDGEKKVWNKFALNLPQQWIVYHNRSVNGREYDFCVMAPDMGLFIIEVKGWKSKNVLTVVDQSTIFIAGSDKPEDSPRGQARGYRFDLLKKINHELGVNPVVMSLVCYPEITEQEYYDKGLNIVSETNETIFEEELDDPAKLFQKFSSRYNIDKACRHDELTPRMFALIRHNFEPNFDLKENLDVLNPGYSRLRVMYNGLNDDLANTILDEYFTGIKEIVFVSEMNELILLVRKLEERFSKRNIYPDKEQLIIGKTEKDVSEPKNTYKIFNFEVEVVSKDLMGDDDLLIEEGEFGEISREVLLKLAENSEFNFQQYEIEHVPCKNNILVSAGAGTGKTHSMVSRVAYLCNRSADSVVNLASDIAMITFTNDAADNMKRRLKKMFMNYFILTSNEKYMHFIEDLNQAQISTIHKFAISLLKRDCLRFGLGYDSRVTAETYNRKMLYHRFMNEYLDKKLEASPDFAYQLNLPIYELEKMLISFSDQLYSKSIDIKKLTLNDFGTAINSMPYFNELIEQVAIKAEKEYSIQLKASNLLNLNESMILINDLVTAGKLMRQGNKYKYVFVDEFQDTDDSQIDMITGLQKSFGSQCRLFVVGDLKQSIYRFRGATLSAFDKVKSTFGIGEWSEYTLNRNYRTDKRLLDNYHRIFVEMGAEGILPYEEKRDRLLSREYKEYKDNELIKKIECHSKDQEAYYGNLFDEIKEQCDKITLLDREKNLKPEERIIAILVRYNWQINTIIREGAKAGIPIKVTEGGDLYRLPSSLELYKLVMAITHPQNKVYLMNLLSTKYISLDIDEAALSGISAGEKTEELTRLLDKYFVIRLGKKWSQIVSDFETRPALVVLRDIYEATKPWQKYKDKDLRESYKQNYECLIEKFTSYYSREYLTINKIEQFLKINITTFQEEASRTLTEETSKVKVVCTTIHKSKGLEYGTVILPFTNEDISDIKVRGLNVNMIDGKVVYSFSYGKNPMEFSGGFDENNESKEKTREESRILYVAMTRAIRNLIWIKDLDEKKNCTWGSFMEVE